MAKTAIVRLRHTQKKLRESLWMLFKLLEVYSPLWYEKHHHDKALAALNEAQRTAQKARRKSRD